MSVQQVEKPVSTLAGEEKKARMGPAAVQTVIDTLKEEDIDLVITLPEEPTYSLTEAIRSDPYFTSLTAAGEGNGIAACAGAALAGRSVVFVTGVAGLMVGTWALAQMGMFGAPMIVIVSYRGDFGDRTGIPGSQLMLFKSVCEPLLNTLKIPYRVIDQESQLKKAVIDAHFMSQNYATPVVLLMTGEVLW